ncbi:MAG TPA: TonB-dependent receptor [Opitutaceae bacterium]
MTTKKTPALLALSASSLGLAAAAFAQSTAPAATTGGSVVEMEKFVAVAASADRANNVLNPSVQATVSPAVSAIDLMQLLPGVLINQGDAYGGDDWSTRINVRGFQAGQLGFSVDGIPNGNTGYGGGTKPNRFIDPENVAVLTVSQGSGDVASAGAQALGGTFDYASIAPATQAGIHSALTVGDNELRRVFARFNTGLLGGHTRAYVSFSDQSHHRWMSTGSEAGVTERSHVDAKSVTSLGTVEITARFSWDDIFEPNYDSVTLADFAVTPQWDGLTGEWTGSPNTDQNYIKGWNTIRENTLAALELLTRPTDELTLKVEPYWQHQKGSGGWLPPYRRMGWDAAGNSVDAAPHAAVEARAFFQDANGNLLPVPTSASATPPAGVTFYTPSDPFDITTYPVAVQAGAKPVQSYRTSEYLFDRYGVTFGGEWKIDSRNTLKAGGWYERLRREPGRDWHRVLDAQVGWESDALPYWTDFLSELDTDTLMFYAQDTFTLGNLSLSGGARIYYVDLKYRDQFGLRPNRSLNSDSDVLPSVGAVYRLGSGRGEVFGGYSENFKAIEDNIIAGTDEVSKSLEPEASDSFDFGYRLTRGRFSGSISGYYIKFDNRIESVTPLTNGGVTQIDYDIGQNGGYVNVGGIESQGVEIAASAQLTRVFGAYLSVTLNQSEYTTTIPENGVVEGNTVVGSPEMMVAGSLFYRDGPYRASLTGKYTGDRYGTLDNQEIAPAYAVWDASLGYHRELPAGNLFGAVGLDLRVQNLFDKSYLSGVESDSSETQAYYFIGAPRTVSFTLTLEF